MKKETLHKRTKKTILEWIVTEKYKIGDKLPTDRKLVDSLNVSRITILRALTELNDEGYITREQGRGTYVKNTKPSQMGRCPVKNKVKISFGINGFREYRYFYRYLAMLFQQEHPDTEIEIISVPMSARATDFPYLTKIASGNAPSVGEFFMHADYAVLNGLIPLESLQGFEKIADSLHPQLKNIKTVNADNSYHIHALPIQYLPRVIFANTLLLEEAGVSTEKGPESLEELSEWICAISKLTKQKKEESYAFSIDLPKHCDAAIAYYPYIWNHSGYAEANNKKEFAEMLRKSDKWLEYICELFQKNASYKQANKASENFVLGKIALLLSDSSSVFRVKDNLYPEFEIKAFQIPPLNKKDTPITAIGDMSLGIFRAGIKNEAELEASWRWIKFLLRPQIQTLIADAYWAFPASVKAQIPRFSDHNSKILTEVMKNAYPQYDFKGIRQALTLLSREILNAINGKKSSSKAILDASEKILESV